MQFNEIPEFTKEKKRLTKKYKSLPEDLRVFCQVINVAPLGNNKHFTVITHVEMCSVVKARLFCRYLKGSSKLRIVYAFFEDTEQIEFIELYFKGAKNNEDRERIKDFLERQP